MTLRNDCQGSDFYATSYGDDSELFKYGYIGTKADSYNYIEPYGQTILEVFNVWVAPYCPRIDLIA